MSRLGGTRASDADAAVRTEREEFAFEARELLSLMVRRGRWIAGCVAFCATGALAAAALREPVYIGTAQILLDPRGLNVVGDQVVPQPPSADVNDAVIDTEMRLLSSDRVLGAVVEACGLQDDPAFVGRLGLLARAEVALGLRGAAPRRADAAGLAIGALRQRIAVQRDGKSFVVNVTTRANAPAQAARIAKATADSFLGALVAQRRDLVTRAQGAMEATLGGQRDRVVRAEDDVERYKKQVGIVDADGRTLNIASITQLDSQILVAHAATAALAARLAQLDTARRSLGQSQQVDSPLLTQLRSSRADIARQQANLVASLGPRHPQVQEIEAQSRSLDRAIVAEISHLTAIARADYGSAVKREQALVSDRARLENRVADANTALVEMRQLEREADAQRGVYEKFLGRERELQEQETVSPVNATLISEPTASDVPVGVKPGLLLVAGAVFGLLLGTALAWAFERWTGRVYSAGRLGARMGIPVLGCLAPAIAASAGRSVVGCALAEGRGNPTSRLIQRLAHALDRGGGPSCLLVLPAGPRGASSLVASGVVLAVAALGRRVLLVQPAPRDDDDRLAVDLDLRPGTTASCEVEGFPPFDVEHLGSLPSLASWDRREPDRASRHDHVVIELAPDADDNTIRGLAGDASAVVIVVEEGTSTFSEIESLRGLLGDDADVGLLFATPGSDPVRILPAKAVPIALRPELPRALRASQS